VLREAAPQRAMDQCKTCESDKAAREVINKYELYHKGSQGKPEAMKACVVSAIDLLVPLTSRHVLLTTYDMITGSEVRVFKRIPRWEMIVVDEGQRRQLFWHPCFARADVSQIRHQLYLQPPQVAEQRPEGTADGHAAEQ